MFVMTAETSGCRCLMLMRGAC